MNIKHSVILANLTWNESGWRNVYLNSKAHHGYAKKFPGHESLNFDFNKTGLDTNKFVYGYFQSRYSPVNFSTGGTIFFFSNDYINDYKTKIIGIYSKAEILKVPIIMKRKGFEKNELLSNIRAEKDYSILFPIPLDLNNYCNGVRYFTYKNVILAKKILRDEIVALSASGRMLREYNKLIRIYEYATGEKYSAKNDLDPDEVQQNQLVEIFKRTKTKEEIIFDLLNIDTKEPEEIIIKGKSYKRNNKVIAYLKILRNFECQICRTKILKQNGTYYCEAAHIQEKHNKGPETADNLLILCPNHHKEFDLGKKKVIMHTKDSIRFELNNKKYTISLKIK